MASQPPVHVNISTLTIVKVLLIALVLSFFWSIRDIIAMVFMAWVIASALNPWIDRMQRWRIPRGLGILSVYLAAAIIVVGIIMLIVPPVSSELASIAKNFPAYYAPIRESIDSLQAKGEEIGILASAQQVLDDAVRGIANLTSGLYAAAASVFSGVIMAIGVLVIAFYLTVEEEGIKKFIQSISPVKYQPYITQKVNEIQRRLSGWLGGQLILMLFVGVITGVSLWLLGVKYALVLGIIAGFLEFIPIIGPTLAAIPAVFFALTDFPTSPYKPFLVILLFIVIQQLENQFLVPRVMRRTVGVNPIIVILAVLIGAKLGGLLGLILAVPAVVILDTFLKDFLETTQREKNRLEE